MFHHVQIDNNIPKLGVPTCRGRLVLLLLSFLQVLYRIRSDPQPRWCQMYGRKCDKSQCCDKVWSGHVYPKCYELVHDAYITMCKYCESSDDRCCDKGEANSRQYAQAFRSLLTYIRQLGTSLPWLAPWTGLRVSAQTIYHWCSTSTKDVAITIESRDYLFIFVLSRYPANIIVHRA